MAKKITSIILIVGAIYMMWGKMRRPEARVEPLYSTPYVVVYGRDSCGWTAKYVREIHGAGLDHTYKSVDDRTVANELHPRMEEAGLRTSSYLLPVIDVNGVLLIRPDMTEVISIYRE